MSKLTDNYNNYPLETLAVDADRVIRAGGTVYMKWTCGGCGDRVTASNPNLFTTFAKHDECGHVTNTAKVGANYMAILDTNAALELERLIKLEAGSGAPN